MMSKLNLQSFPQKVKQVVSQSMPPDTILLNLDTGYYYTTNQIGEAFFESCNGKKTLVEIISDISTRCGVGLEVIQEDIISFATEMVKEGLLEVKAEQGK